jgi:hypothetical protein
MRKIIFPIFTGLFLFSHFLLLFIYNSPLSVFTENLKSISEQYAEPLFTQNWALFAPAPRIKMDAWLVDKDFHFINNPKREKESMVYNTILFYQSLVPESEKISGSSFNPQKEFVSKALNYALRKDPAFQAIDRGFILITKVTYASPDSVSKCERIVYEFKK